VSVHRLDALRAHWRETFLGRCVGTFLDLQGIDRAMAIAAQAFTALIPLLLLASALAPMDSRNAVSDAIIGRFRLTGDAAHEVETLFAASESGSIGALSVVLVVFSAVSLTRRLQRMYLQAWRLEPRTGGRATLNAAFGLTALFVQIALLYLLRQLIGLLSFSGGLGWALSLVASLVLWTTIPWLLLDGRIPWRRLLPAGALTAVCVGAYSIAAALYMPRLVDSYCRRYGIFGVTLALVGWLLVSALIVIAATVVAAEFDRAQEGWTWRLRSALRIQAAAGTAPPEPRKPPDDTLPPGPGGPPVEGPAVEGSARQR
jgi:membrane protein